GSVIVNYVDEAGNPLRFKKGDEIVEGDQKVVTDGKANTPYNTVDDRPNSAKTPEGKTYELVPSGDYPVGAVTGGALKETETPLGTDAPEGTIEAGKTKRITFVYREVKGDVVVLYREKGTGTPIIGTGDNGQKIGNVSTLDTQDKKDDIDRTTWNGAVIDTPASSTGEDYTTTDNHPATITTADGKIYKRVEGTEGVSGKETGKVVEGTTRVVYYYELQKGSVDVTYVDTDGKPINFVKEGDTEVLGRQEVVKDKDSGTDYQTKTDELRPPTLKTKDGKVYKLVPKGIYPMGSVDEDGRKEDSAPAGGKVTDKHQTVTYVYEEVKGGEVTAQYYV
ncbi:MucBP domain-containing protein, partial [Streptococcus sp. ZJ93]|uniref:MucBP domain-containing protein n=1 Tax=Streptococcus handemini TaxID=3161188 RepID=UPI0034D50240